MTLNSLQAKYFSYVCCHLLTFFYKINFFQKNYFRYIIIVSNSLDTNYLHSYSVQWRIQRGFRVFTRTSLSPTPFLNIPRRRNNLVSLRPNYLISMGYLRNNEIESAKGTPSFTHPNHLSRNSGYAPAVDDKSHRSQGKS